MQQYIQWFKSTNTILKLVVINVSIFVIVSLVGIFSNITNGTGQVHGNWLVNILAANSGLIDTLSKPWSLITYMFLHQSFMHIFYNMLILFYAGRLFTTFLQEKRVLSTYILGGFSGLALYMLSYNIFPQLGGGFSIPILGASASVMAILVAVAAYVPNYSVVLMFLGPVKLKYIAIFYVALDFLALQGSVNLGGHIAHLGGALYGFVMVKQLGKGNDWSKYFYAFTQSIAGIFRKRPRIKIVHKKERPVSDATYNERKKSKQEEVDRILDKISKSGYDSLSKDEKVILFQASNE